MGLFKSKTKSETIVLEAVEQPTAQIKEQSNVINNSRSDWKLSEKDYGPLWEYVANDDIVDINLNQNGTVLWVNSLEDGKFKVDSNELEKKMQAWYDTLEHIEKNTKKTKNLVFVEQFAQRVSNMESKSFNKHSPLLEAESDELRISIVHKSVASSGYSICIRKTPMVARITVEKALNEGYCSQDVLNLLVNCVKTKMNFVVCGEPGVGKTEGVKLLSRFIRAEERVITIEDSLELHYKEIYPERDCVALKIIEPNFTYSTAIKACLRQNPQWIMLSEARSVEVKYLLESWSTGVCGMTTLHTDDVRKIPDRIQNMLGDKIDASRLENDIYSFVNIGLLIRMGVNRKGKRYRYIDQVCFFSRENEKNKVVMIVEDGELLTKDVESLPISIRKKMKQKGIDNPFVSTMFEEVNEDVE